MTTLPDQPRDSGEPFRDAGIPTGDEMCRRLADDALLHMDGHSITTRSAAAYLVRYVGWHDPRAVRQALEGLRQRMHREVDEAVDAQLESWAEWRLDWHGETS